METIMLKIIRSGQDIPDNCSFCGKEGDDNDRMPTYNDGIEIFRCKSCGELDGFFVLEDYDDESFVRFNDDEPDDRQYSTKEGKNS